MQYCKNLNKMHIKYLFNFPVRKFFLNLGLKTYKEPFVSNNYLSIFTYIANIFY